MRLVLDFIHHLTAITVILALFLATVLAIPESGSTCDSVELHRARAEFKRLEDLRRSDPDAVPEFEFRSASRDLVRAAEACYLARYGSMREDRRIDDGGLWADTTNSNQDFRTAASGQRPGVPTKYNLFGTKWGADSPYFTPVGNHHDALGPRSAGGVVTYSFMPNGVDLSAEGGGTSTAIGALATFESCFYQEITDAFAAWSAIADIQFLPVTDNGLPADYPGASGDIRIGAHYIDGVDGVVAHAYYPPPNGYSIAGDLHFDISESWVCDPRLVTGWEIDIGLVALHEIGHSLGLGHEVTDPAIMEAAYNPALDFGPVADDIIGIAEVYGPSPVGSHYFAGDVGIGTDHPEASVHVKREGGVAKLLLEGQDAQILVRSGWATTQFAAIDDATGGYFSIIDGKDGPYFPLFWFSGVGTNGNGGGVVSELPVANDVFSGNEKAALVLEGRRSDGTNLVNTNILAVRNKWSPKLWLTASGNLYATGSITPGSSRDLKEEIGNLPLGDALKVLAGLNPVTFRYKDDQEKDLKVGFIAEDVPELVATPDRRGVSPMDIVAILTRVVQDQQRVLHNQQERISRLEAGLAESESQSRGR